MIYSCSRGITTHGGTFRLVMKMYEIIPAKLLPAKKNAPQEFVHVVKGIKRRRRNSQKYAALPLHTRTLTHTGLTHSQVLPQEHIRLCQREVRSNRKLGQLVAKVAFYFRSVLSQMSHSPLCCLSCHAPSRPSLYPICEIVL